MKKVIKVFIAFILTLNLLVLIGCKKNQIAETRISRTLVSSNLICASKDGKWGYVDKGGNTIISFKYDTATVFEDDRAIVSRDYANFIIDAEGKTLSDGYYKLTYLGKGLFKYFKDYKYGLVDKDGKVITEALYDDIGSINGKLIPVSLDKKYGAINLKGKLMIEPAYDSLYTDDNGYFIAVNNEKYGYVNSKGKLFIDTKYDKAYSFIGGYAKVTIDGKDYLIDEKENIKFTAPDGYAIVTDGYSNKYVIVQNTYNSRQKLFDIKGNELLGAFSQIFFDYIGKDYFIYAFNYNQENKLQSFEIYNFDMKLVASSKSLISSYYLTYVFYDYVRGYYYFRMTDDDNSNVVYRFNGKELKPADIATEAYISSIVNGVVVLQDSSGAFQLMTDSTVIFEITGITNVVSITDDGYVVYATESGVGVCTNYGGLILSPVYESIKIGYKLS